MLFITSRTPLKKSPKSQKNRKLEFDLQNTDVSRYEYFCRRHGANDYTEIMAENLFAELKGLPDTTQLLFYIHGFNNNPEDDVFPRAERLEFRINEAADEQLVKVIPIIWPCDDDHALAFADDYWDDQKASKLAGMMYARLFGKFDRWRKAKPQVDIPCLKRINILAHSMGNNVLQHAINEWAQDSGKIMPQWFRNIFMVAADVENQTLEPGQIGQYIPDSARNVAVYFANDDFAMPASKVANIKNLILSRRLGMTGPESMNKISNKVIAVDCDDFNNSIDKPKGHSYFIEGGSIVSPCIKHMTNAIKTGRVEHTNRRHNLAKPAGL